MGNSFYVINLYFPCQSSWLMHIKPSRRVKKCVTFTWFCSIDRMSHQGNKIGAWYISNTLWGVAGFHPGSVRINILGGINPAWCEQPFRLARQLACQREVGRAALRMPFVLARPEGDQ